MLDFKHEVSVCNLILRKFDEDLSQKVSKASFKEIYEYCHNNFEAKGSLDSEFDKKVKGVLSK